MENPGRNKLNNIFKFNTDKFKAGKSVVVLILKIDKLLNININFLKV
jgi:hypothetical protein